MQKNDWVKILYGEYKDAFGKVTGIRSNGDAVVVAYGADGIPGKVVYLALDCLELIPPFIFSKKDLKDIVSFEKTMDDFKSSIYPSLNFKTEGTYPLSIDDIKKALEKINSNTNSELDEFKKWYWMIINLFYEDLEIKERYRENVIADFPDSEEDVFSTVYGMLDKLYWKIEEHHASRENDKKYLVKFDNEPRWEKIEKDSRLIQRNAYLAVCHDIIERIDSFHSNEKKPPEERTYSRGQMKHVILSYDKEENLKDATPEAKDLFRRFVFKLYEMGDIAACKILAFSFYEGNEIFNRDYNLAKLYLLALFEKTGDPGAACALGNIYYEGFLMEKIPQYHLAFKYFSFGALAGIDECILRSADMLIAGQGVEKNVDMGLNLIVDGYRGSMEDFCDGIFEGSFADYAFRMGNASRDNLIFGMGVRDAYRFYLETEYALKKRKKYNIKNDNKFLEMVEKEINRISMELEIDRDRSILKADYPIYVNQIYEERIPVKVMLKKNPGTGEITLGLSRFRISGHVPEILVTYPELSYSNLQREIWFSLEKGNILKQSPKGEVFFSDGFRRNEVTGALEFYMTGELQAVVEAEWFIIKVNKKLNNKNDKEQEKK